MSHHTTSPKPATTPRQRLGLLVTLTLITLATAAQPADAGSYTVSDTCAWEAYNQSAPHYAVYAGPSFGTCPTLVARNVQGNFSTPGNGAAGGWQFVAPPGAVLGQVVLSLQATGQSGWQAAVIVDGGSGSTPPVNCPGAYCPGGSVFHSSVTWGLNGALALRTRVRCGDPGGCANGQIRGQVDIHGANVTVMDATAPAVNAGGDLASGGWHGRTRQLVIDANDNVGVKQVGASIDGVPIAGAERPCNYRVKVPCPNGASALSVPLGGVGEGIRRLTVQAIDTAGNVGGQDREILVDTTAPVAPSEVAIAGGAGWRAQNSWVVRWANPPRQLAPIVGVRYTLCPPEADSADRDVAAKAKKECVSGSRSKKDLTEITDLELPKAGKQAVLRLWVMDAAGNHNPDSAVKITGLGYDPTPPAVAGFAAPDPTDPARVTVRASDEGAPITGGAIELRRHGAKAWRPLPTDVNAGGITAVVDDEALRKGRYELRATVANAAGLQQGTDRATDGTPMTLKLPIRRASRLRAGRLAGKTCRGRGAERRCRQELLRKVPVALGRRITLRGRLVVAGKPVKQQPLEVWQRVSLAGAAWERVGSEQTDARGRIRYKTAEGPARALRFRYPGTPHIRGDNATVRLRVQAATSIKSNRRRAINGEPVTINGQLKGAWRPPAGVLVELQVLVRGRWRTFAQPRADAATGAWSYEHRFETVKAGGARFRFRARIRRQAGLPLATGRSRTLTITVHGL